MWYRCICGVEFRLNHFGRYDCWCGRSWESWDGGTTTTDQLAKPVGSVYTFVKRPKP